MARAMVRPVNPKMQTRRLPAAHNCLVDGHGMSAKRWAAMQFDWANAWPDGHDCIKVASLNPDNHGTVHRIYPRAEPGDVVWGRETHAFSVVDPDGRDWHDDPSNWDVIYRADPDQPAGGWRDADGKVTPAPWRPAIHMPRWAARIVRPIVRMRFERLHYISEADALAEGITRSGAGCHIEGEHGYAAPTAIEVYRQLWEDLNGPHSWDTNPIVLVYEFGAPTP